MILFLLLLIVATGIVAVYAASGERRHPRRHPVAWHWSAVPDWVPVVLTAVVFGGLLLLYMLYSGCSWRSAWARCGVGPRRANRRSTDFAFATTSGCARKNARVRSELRAWRAPPGTRAG